MAAVVGRAKTRPLLVAEAWWAASGVVGAFNEAGPPREGRRWQAAVPPVHRLETGATATGYKPVPRTPGATHTRGHTEAPPPLQPKKER
jgi:hypothetical protein